jgi:hypothetical protein
VFHGMIYSLSDLCTILANTAYLWALLLKLGEDLKHLKVL